MTLLAVVHSETGTFQSFAAACISIARAVAPPLRTYSVEFRIPRLPPVEKSPQARLRATLCPGVGYSVVTLAQSHSSSSATSCASPVSVPWPISERAMRITVVSSGRITTQTLTSGEPSAARTTVGPPKGRSRPSARPAPAAAVPITKPRRLSLGVTCLFMAFPSRVRGGVDRLADLLEGPATADIGDGLVDVLVGRFRLLLEKGCDRHDHAALAIAALRYVVGDPGLLHLVQRAVAGESLDRGDLLADGFADRYAAGAHRDPVDMHSAGAALCNAASVFGAGQPDILPDRPKQRRVVFDIHIDCFAVNCEVCHRVSPVSSIHRVSFAREDGLQLGIVQIKKMRLRVQIKKCVCELDET